MSLKTDRIPTAKRKPHFGGFKSVGNYLQKDLKRSGESRGFATTKLLTHWEEIAGKDIASRATPVKVSFSQKGFGATLVLLTNGANAPLVQMQLEKLKEKVNASYGYHAISRIVLTQTSGSGLFEADQRPLREEKKMSATPPSDEAQKKSKQATDGLTSPELRDALEKLGAQVFNRIQNGKSQ